MSVEPPVIDLFKYKPPVTDIPDWMTERGFTVEKLREAGVVLSTRHIAQKVVADNERHRGAYSVILRCDRVEVATPSFFHELLRTWPRITLAGASEDVQISFDVARESGVRSDGTGER